MSENNPYLVNDLQQSNMRLLEERDMYRKLCLDLTEIIKNANILPLKKSKVMSRHREEWPELWNHIDKIITNY